jgi:hypothetical protein
MGSILPPRHDFRVAAGLCARPSAQPVNSLTLFPAVEIISRGAAEIAESTAEIR